jgi:hypothetical protein
MEPRILVRPVVLSDEPLTIDELLNATARATGRALVRVPLPVGVAKAAIDRVLCHSLPQVRRGA